MNVEFCIFERAMSILHLFLWLIIYITKYLTVGHFKTTRIMIANRVIQNYLKEIFSFAGDSKMNCYISSGL